MGIGFLIYASDNRGRWGMGDPCPGDNNGTVTYRIGSWPAYGPPEWGEDLYGRLYDEWKRQSGIYRGGHDWEGGFDTSYLGRPRLPGKYLPIDAFWDPIAIIRDWDYRGATHSASAGSEKGRDMVSRHREHGINYAYFIGQVGCAARKSEHLNREYYPGCSGWWWDEDPFRWATKSTNLRVPHPPSCWLSACWPPGDTDVWGGPWGSRRRNWWSHFGAREAAVGIFKFNVVHLDGHVDDSLWKWAESVKNHGNPYLVQPLRGWPYGYDNTGGPNYALNREPTIEGAFDENL
jgi:hypothetical protein